MLFKCSITPREPWSVSRLCLESGWISNACFVCRCVQVAKHLAPTYKSRSLQSGHQGWKREKHVRQFRIQLSEADVTKCFIVKSKQTISRNKKQIKKISRAGSCHQEASDHCKHVHSPETHLTWHVTTQSFQVIRKIFLFIHFCQRSDYVSLIWATFTLAYTLLYTRTNHGCYE